MREDLNGKHFDTKIVFHANNERIVMHGYNSTCNLKVEGTTYLSFIENYLTPLFDKAVATNKDKIIDSDNIIIKSLGASNKVRASRSVKSIRSSINQAHIICKKCDCTFNSSTHFRKHKHSEHIKSLNLSVQSIPAILHSTRNNSFSQIMVEDIIYLKLLVNHS